MKLLITMLVTLFIVNVGGCGAVDKVDAHLTGFSRICVDGVQYIQFSSGASVAYTPEGKIKVCS